MLKWTSGLGDTTSRIGNGARRWTILREGYANRRVSLWHLYVPSVVALKSGVRYGAIGNGFCLESSCPIAARVVIGVFSHCVSETIATPHLRVRLLPFR